MIILYLGVSQINVNSNSTEETLRAQRNSQRCGSIDTKETVKPKYTSPVAAIVEGCSEEKSLVIPGVNEANIDASSRVLPLLVQAVDITSTPFIGGVSSSTRFVNLIEKRINIFGNSSVSVNCLWREIMWRSNSLVWPVRKVLAIKENREQQVPSTCLRLMS